MMQQQSFLDDLKRQYRLGGMTMKILYWNIGVFLGYNLLRLLFFLFQRKSMLQEYVLHNLYTSSDPYFMLYHPWTVLTYQFLHTGVWHLLFNMIFFYFASRMFVQFLGTRRLLSTYLLGGFMGWIFHFAANNIFPALYTDSGGYMLGASASVMAVFVGVAAYRPNQEIYLFGMLKLKLKYLAIFFVLTDLLSIEARDQVAHFAHLGGATLGFLMVAWERKGSQIFPTFERWLDNTSDWFGSLFTSKPKMKVKYSKGGKKKTTQRKSAQTDYDFNAEKKKDKKQMDAILDKISKSGYDSLTKAEKSFLFNQSRKNQ